MTGKRLFLYIEREVLNKTSVKMIYKFIFHKYKKKTIFLFLNLKNTISELVKAS